MGEGDDAGTDSREADFLAKHIVLTILSFFFFSA